MIEAWRRADRWPWAKARAELTYGSWLRRQREYAQSGELLRAAQATFRSIGAEPWAARARAELEAALAPELNHRVVQPGDAR